MFHYRNVTEEEKLQQVEDIQRDYDRMSNEQRIWFASSVMDEELFNEALYEFMMADYTSYFRCYLEDYHGLEKLYVEEKLKGD